MLLVVRAGKVVLVVLMLTVSRKGKRDRACPQKEVATDCLHQSTPSNLDARINVDDEQALIV